MKKNCIIFSLLFLIVFGATASAAKGRNDIPADEFLSSVGIVQKDTIEDENENISRGEFAYWASQLIPYKAQFGKSEQEFSDVVYGTKYFDGITKLVNCGIVSGVSEMSFAPDDNIKYEHACAIMVRLLGYDIDVKNNEYVVEAGKIGVTAGVQNSDGYITKANAMKMIYNALFTDLKYDNTVDGEISDDAVETVLEKRFNIYETRGILNDNGISALAGVSNAGRVNVKIGEDLYIYGGETESLLGRSVYAYYNKDSDEIVYVYAPKSKNTVETYSNDEIDGFNNNVYTIYENSSEKKTRKTLAYDYKLIYNTEAVTSALSDEEHLELMKPKCGEVTLVDNNNDGKFDVVIVNSYETVVLSAYDSNAKVLYNRIEGAAPISLKDIKDVEFVGSDGKYLDENNLVKNRVLSVMKPLSNRYCKIIISSDIVSGKLSAVKENGKKVVVNDTEYKIADDLKDNITIPANGKNVEVYLRHDGKAAYFTSEAADNEMMVYIQKLYCDNQERYCMKVYTEDNNTRELYFPDGTTVVDGTKFKNAKDASNYIKNSIYGEDHLAVVKLKKRDRESEVADTVASVDLAYYRSTGINGGDLHIVDGIYKKNGLINKVSVDGTIGASAQTKAFFIPESGELSDAKATTFSAASINLSANYVYSVYSLNKEDIIADAILIRTGGGYDIKNSVIANARTNYIIADMEQVINADGENGWKLYLTTGGTYASAYTKTLDGIKCMKSGNEASIGDIIKFGTDRNGMIPDGQLVIMYSPSHNKETLIYNTGSFSGGKNSIANWSAGLIMATPLRKNESYIKIDNTPVGMIPLQGAYVVVYDDEARQKVSEGKVTDINTYDIVGDDASITIYNFRENYASYIYVVR